MTSTTTIQRQMTSKGNDISKLSSSIFHSIRHTSQFIKYDKDGREIEMWNAKKIDNSFMMLNNKKLNLAELSDDEKEQIVNELLKPELDDFNDNNPDDDLDNQINDLNEKVLKRKSNLKRNGPLFKEFGELKDEHISDEDLQYFIDQVNKDDEIKRKNQKIKSMQQFQEDNNKLVELRSGKSVKMDKRKGLIQESFLKFPRLPNGTISQDRYCEILEGYYQEHFPDYQIKALFFHGDEESINKNLNADCGWHSHIFVSCKNTETGKYDLVKQQKLKAIEYIKNNPDEFPHIEPENLKTNYNLHRRPRDENGNVIGELSADQKKQNREMTKYISSIGIAQQAMILKYGQEQLKKDGVKLYRNDYDTPEEKQRLLQMEKDKHLPKNERVANSHNQRLIIEEETKLNDLKRENKRVLAETNDLKYQASNLKDYIDTLKTEGVQTVRNDIRKYINEEFHELRNQAEKADNPNTQRALKVADNNKKYFEPAIDFIENDLNKDNSILKKLHKACHIIPGYEELYNYSKSLYFVKYEEIKGVKHPSDPATGEPPLNPPNTNRKFVNDRYNKINKKYGGLSDAQVSKLLDDGYSKEQSKRNQDRNNNDLAKLTNVFGGYKNPEND